MKKKRNLIVVCCVAVVIFVATTIAYFSNGFDFLTGFGAEPFNTSVTEQFVSPQNWKPGDVTDKQVIATNNSDIDVAVRLSYTEKWVTANGDTISNKNNGEKMAIINLDNRNDWIKRDGYYYYNDILSKNESTSSFLSSVTFNPSAVIGEQDCTTSNDETEITCISGGDGYDNATYSLTFNIEFVQADQYKKVWNTDFTFGDYYPDTFANYIIDNSYGDIENLNSSLPMNQTFSIERPATMQTPDLTEYRYIGRDVDNYIYFNCSDELDTSTCEVWRIIGVFNVQNQFGKYKQRIKIVRGDSIENMSYSNYLQGVFFDKVNNGDYWNSLSSVSKSMISTTKYYLGEISNYSVCYDSSSITLYEQEREKDAYVYRKIASMYPSDFIYSFNMTSNLNHSWMYASDFGNSSIYLLNKGSSNYKTYFYTSSYCVSQAGQYTNYSVRPTLYLNENVELVSGNGKIDNPYQIKIKSFNLSIPESELYSAPESAAIGSDVSIDIDDTYEIVSFKLNGNLITGNSFIMPGKDSTITDIQYKKVRYNIINNDTDVIVQENAHIGDTVYLSSNDYMIQSFKVNGVLTNGRSFVMPEEDVVITDVEKIDYPTIESEHYPYPSSQSYVQVYENTFEGAKSITLQISYQFCYSSSALYIYNSSSASNYSYLTRFYGTQSSITDTSYTVNGNYVKIKFSSSTYTSSYANYYGYKIKIIPNYD